MLSPRRRILPTSLVITGALALGTLGAVVPAQATPVPTSLSSATTTSVGAAAAPTQTAAAVRAARAAARTAAIAARAAKARSTAVRVARRQVGDRYVAGRSGPNAFDCSGLARFVVKHATGRSLPHYSKSQFHVTKRVSRKHLRPGDLVFFFKYGTHHVGVYVGHGRMVNATNPRSGVRVDRVFSGWYGARYSGAGRLVRG